MSSCGGHDACCDACCDACGDDDLQLDSALLGSGFGFGSGSGSGFGFGLGCRPYRFKIERK